MIKVEHIQTWGFEHAIRGMRNSFASWDKSDSRDCLEVNCHECRWAKNGKCINSERLLQPVIGDNDLALMQKLHKAGSSVETATKVVIACNSPRVYTGSFVSSRTCVYVEVFARSKVMNLDRIIGVIASIAPDHPIQIRIISGGSQCPENNQN